MQNVVLGELIRLGRRGYGYELRDRLRELFSDVLELSDTAIYQALRALDERGLVTVVEREEVGQGGRRSGRQRVYYDITEEGRKHFRAWMDEAPKKAPLREDLHMRMMVAGLDDVPGLVVALRQFEDQCRRQLGRIIERPLGTSSAATSGVRALGASLVQDALVAHLQTTMEWAQRSRGTLQRLVEHPTGVPGRHRP